MQWTFWTQAAQWVIYMFLPGLMTCISWKTQARRYIRETIWCSRAVNILNTKFPPWQSRFIAATASQKISCPTRLSCSSGWLAQLILPSAVTWRVTKPTQREVLLDCNWSLYFSIEQSRCPMKQLLPEPRRCGANIKLESLNQIVAEAPLGSRECVIGGGGGRVPKDQKRSIVSILQTQVKILIH